MVISEFAVNSAQGKNHLEVRGHSFSLPDAIFLSAILLVIYSGAGIAAALSSTSMSSKALASARNKMIDAFFGASWTVQSQERLGHIQQILTVNCETIGETTLGMAVGLQALLTVVALFVAAFLVSPIAATMVVVFGILLRRYCVLSIRGAGKPRFTCRKTATLWRRLLPSIRGSRGSFAFLVLSEKQRWGFTEVMRSLRGHFGNGDCYRSLAR